MWDHLDRFLPRRLVVAEERPVTLGGGLSVVAARGAATPGPQAENRSNPRLIDSQDLLGANPRTKGRGLLFLEWSQPPKKGPEACDQEI